MNSFKVITGTIAAIFVSVATLTGNYSVLSAALLFALMSIDSMIQEGK